MRQLLLLILIGCGDNITPVEVDAPIYCGPSTVCDAARHIAAAYCGRQATCFNITNPSCIDDVVETLCSENNCSVYYPSDNRTRLDECLNAYNMASCAGPNPPICKLY